MLRITKKERAQLNSMNARIRRKQKNLKTTFNIDTNFEITTPSKFLTRAEVNLYKKEAKHFLSPYTHNYVKMGIKRGSQYYFYVTRQEYRDLQKAVKRQNAYARKLMKKADSIPLTQSGKNQAITVASYISQIRPKIEREGLKSPYAQFFPIKIQKSSIRSREHFENFRNAIKGFHTAKAYKKINKQAQANFIQALENTFGANAEPLIVLISQLDGNDFLSFYESDVDVDFDYIYDVSQVMKVLASVSNGLLRWLANSEEYVKKKYLKEEFIDNIEQVKKVANYDSAVILSDLNLNVRTFTNPETGFKYTGVFRKREAQMIDEGHITQDIINKATRIE